MKIYQAGPLFTQAERDFNVGLAKKLREAGYEVFLPQETELANKADSGTRGIFLGDVAGIDWAEVVVAVLDGSDVDSGTAWECGYAYAQNKPIYGIRTDFRLYGPAEKINLMIGESCDIFVDSVDALLETLRDHVTLDL